MSWRPSPGDPLSPSALLGERAGSPPALGQRASPGLPCSLPRSRTPSPLPCRGHALSPPLPRYVLRDKESTVRVDLSQLRHGRCYPTSHPLGHSPHPMPHPGTPAAGPSGAPPVGGVPGLGPMASAAAPMARPRPASEAGDWVSCGNWAGDAAVPRCAGGPRHAGGDVNPSRSSTLWTPSFRAQVSEAPCAQLALARATAHPPSSPSRPPRPQPSPSASAAPRAPA